MKHTVVRLQIERARSRKPHSRHNHRIAYIHLLHIGKIAVHIEQYPTALRGEFHSPSTGLLDGRTYHTPF